MENLVDVGIDILDQSCHILDQTWTKKNQSQRKRYFLLQQLVCNHKKEDLTKRKGSIGHLNLITTSDEIYKQYSHPVINCLIFFFPKEAVKFQQKPNNLNNQDQINKYFVDLLIDIKNEIEKQHIQYSKQNNDELMLCLKYLIEKKFILTKKFIDCGGQGVVLLGICIKSKGDYKNGQELAIKFTFNSKEMEHDQRIQDQIKSRYFIVRQYESFMKNDTLIQIMEYCSCNLQKQIVQRQKNKTTFSFQQIVKIMFQGINIIVELHVNNIVHLDIKPQNIMIDEECNLKLVDFGAAQDSKNIDTSKLFYTLTYCSVEQLNAEKGQGCSIDEKTDVFSLGLTFLKILFPQLNRQIADRIRSGNFSDIKVEKEYQVLYAFIQYFMLCKDPKQRKRSLELYGILVRYLIKFIDLSQEINRIDEEIKLHSEKQDAYLAYLYCLQGQLDIQPIENFKKALQISNKIDDFSQIDQCYFSLKLGQSYISNQLYKEGTKILKDLLAQIKDKKNKYQKYNNDHPYTAEILNGLGLSYLQQGKNKKARTLLQYSLNIRQEQYLVKFDGLKYVKQKEDHPELAQSIHSLGVCFTRLGLDKIAVRYKRKGLLMRERLFIGDHLDISDSLTSLAVTLSILGQDSEAQILFERSLKMQQNIYKNVEQNLDFADTINSYSVFQAIIGEYTKAEQLNLKALEIRKKKGNQLEIAQSQQSLANLYLKMGKLNEAYELIQSAFQVRKRLLQQDHADLAFSYHSRGQYFTKIGNFQAALKNFQKSYNIRKKFFSQKHIYTAISLNSLAECHGALGAIKVALKLDFQALEIRKEILEGNHYFIAQSYNSIGISQQKLGDYNKALEYFQKALSMRVILYKNNHPDIAESLNNLGILYQATGKLKEAKTLLKQALQIRKYNFQRNHASISDTLYNLSVSYQQLGKYKKSLEYGLEALQIRETIYKGDHSNIAQSQYSLAITYEKKGDSSKSLEYFKECLLMRIRLFNRNHPDIAQSFFSLGIYFGRQGNEVQAEQYFLVALKIKNKIYKCDHPEIALSLNILGVLQSRRGNHQLADQYLKEALDMRKKLYSGFHLDIAESLNSMGESYGRRGDFKRAISFLSQSLEMKEKLLHRNHPDIAILLYNLGYSYEKIDQNKKAIQMFKRSLDIRKINCSENNNEISQSYFSLGILNKKIGNYQQAINNFQKSLKIQQNFSKGYSLHQEEIINILIVCYDQSRNFKKSEQQRRKLIKMKKKVIKQESFPTSK